MGVTWDDKDNQRSGGTHWDSFGPSLILPRLKEFTMVQG